MSRPLEILGITPDGELAFRFGDAEELTLGESDLIELMSAIQRDYLPLWPVEPCRVCGENAVAVVYGDALCEGHALSVAAREDEGSVR